MEYFLFDIKNNKCSKKTWKTYQGASKNAGEFDMVFTSDSKETVLAWMEKYPEWSKERIASVEKNKP